MKRYTILLALLVSLSICSSIYSQTLAIKAGHLIDPSDGTVKVDQIILVTDKKITAVGPDLDISRADRVIDLSDSYVLPGLMDTHVHMTFGLTPYSDANSDWEMFFLKETTAYRALRGMRKSKEALESGFTTLKDIGNDANYAMMDVRKAIETGYFTGPTLFTSGKIIAPFGGQSSGFSYEQGRFWQYEYIDADTPDEIRKAVRENIYYGANTIKLVADNGIFFYTEEEVRAAVEETHNAGLTISVHVYGGQAATNVINAEPESIEHGTNLSDDQLRLMKEKGIILVGTDFPEEHLKAMGSSDENARQTAAAIVDRLRRAHRIGVKMAFGTDVILDLPGMTRGEMALDYLKVWRAAGIPHGDILKSMTTIAAELLDIQDERGAIAVGQFADIIAIPDNPLDDIEALKKVNFVLKDGTIIKIAH
ncbi:amidohydrolase family protein [candidate division KSB1 bacterium]|nr:amidohydrolase family protein [candidate division KSB1 bacterium]